MITYQKGVAGVSKDKERKTPSTHIKLQYQVVSILPLRAYEDFIRVCACACSLFICHVCVYAYMCICGVCGYGVWWGWCVGGYAIDYCCFESVGLQFLKTDYSVICDVLEPVISAKAKVSSSSNRTRL